MYLYSKKGTHWLRTFPFTKGKAVWIKASKYRLKLLIHTSFLIQICWHICYWINIFNGCLQPPNPQHLPPPPNSLLVDDKHVLNFWPQFCEWKTKRLGKLHTSKRLAYLFRHYGVLDIFNIYPVQYVPPVLSTTL